MKKILFFMLGVLLALPGVARDFTYEYGGQTLTYTVLDEDAKTCKTKDGRSDEWAHYSGNTVSGELVIPALAKDGDVEYSVTTIGDLAFSKCTDLTSVIIPNSVTSIGKSAFSDCKGLTSVTIPNSVTSIGSSAFNSCYGLTSVTIPNSVTTIADFTFQGCEGLTSVDIPNSVTSIGRSAFNSCYKLTSVVIPASVTSIDNYAFYYCSHLNWIIIGNSVTSIGRGAFDYCTDLKKVAYPSGLYVPFSGEITAIEYPREGTEIEGGFVISQDRNVIYFAPLSLEGEYAIPNNVCDLGDRAFSRCIGLTSVTIPNSVTKIGDFAFYGCSGLKDVVIGNSVTSIGDDAFNGCSALSSVTIPNSVSSIGVGALSGCSSLTSVILSNSITSISDHLFDGCSALTKVDIPNAVTEIGAVAFRNCSNLTEITIPEHVTSIGNEAFYRCSGLKSLCLGNSVATIGNYAFWYCSELTEVIIPNSVTRIGAEAFTYCYGLKKCAYPSDLSNNPFPYGIPVEYPREGAIVEDGYVYGPDKNAIYFVPLTLDGEYVIPNTVATIGELAFKGCTGMTSVVIPASVAIIGEDAFSDCSGLASLSIPNSVTSIGNTAFAGCSGIPSLTIPASVATIGTSAFKDCSNLKSLTIDDSDKNLHFGEKVFEGVQLQEVYLGRNFDYDGEYTSSGPFFGTTYEPTSKISKLTISSNVTRLYSGSFHGCQSLTSVIIPNSVVSIGSYAFSRCYRLSSVIIGNSVTSVGTNAFEYCDLTKTAYPSGIDNPFPNGDAIEYPREGSIIEDGFVYGPDKKAIYFAPLSLHGEFVIPNSVNTIGKLSFYHCTGLTSVSIPNSVETIDDFAFVSCTNLTSADLPESLKAIGGYAFRYCTSLPSVVIPNSVTSVGDYAFTECSALASVIIGNSVKRIGASAFYYCDNLKKSAYPSNLYNVFKRGTVIEYPAEGAIIEGGFVYGPDKKSIYFAPLSLKEEFILPNGVVTIGPSAFAYCTTLESIVFSPSVETVGISAFAGSSKLGWICMGAKVKTIGAKAFDGCPATNIYITAQTPPTAPDNTFSSYSGALILQEGANGYSAYRNAATCWNHFSDFFSMRVATGIDMGDSPKTINGKPGDTFQLTANLIPYNATMSNIFWRSTNPKIATVDKNGVVTLHADMSDIVTMAQGDANTGIRSCKIIAESLYADGPIAEFTVNDISSGIEDVTVDGGNECGDIDYSAPVEVYDLQGARVADTVENLSAGIYIVRQGNLVKKIALR